MAMLQTVDPAALEELFGAIKKEASWVHRPYKALREPLTVRVINDLLAALPERQQVVVVRCFGLADGRQDTLTSIASDLGVSRERVRQFRSIAVTGLLRILSTRHWRHEWEAASDEAARLAVSVEILDLPTGVMNCLYRDGYFTLGDLVSKTEEYLVEEVLNLGKAGVRKIKAELAKLGLALAENGRQP